MHPLTRRSMMPILIGIVFTVALPAALFIFAPQFLLKLTSVSYFFLFFALFLLLSPLGSIAFKTDKRPLPFLQWLGVIFIVELAAVLLFYSFTHTALTYNPNPFLMQIPLIPELTWRWGWYPWSLVSIISVCFAFLHFNQQTFPILSSLIPTLKKYLLRPIYSTFYPNSLERSCQLCSNVDIKFWCITACKNGFAISGFYPHLRNKPCDAGFYAIALSCS